MLRHAGGDLERHPGAPHRLPRRGARERRARTRSVQPRLSLGAQRALARAALRVESTGRDEVRGSDLLVAIYDEPESYAADMLEDEGVTRLDVVSYLAHGVSKLQPAHGIAHPGRRRRGRRRARAPRRAATTPSPPSPRT